MAFPSSVGARQANLAQALERITQLAGRLKGETSNIRSASLAGPVTGEALLNYAAALASVASQMSAFATAPGLAAYARAQYGDGSIDIVADYATMTARMNDLRAWIVANFPKDAGGYLLHQQFDQAGAVQLRTFTTAALAPFRAQLDALLATID